MITLSPKNRHAPNSQSDHGALDPGAPEPGGLHQRGERQDPPFSKVVGAHDEAHVLDGDDQGNRPEDQRDHAVILPGSPGPHRRQLRRPSSRHTAGSCRCRRTPLPVRRVRAWILRSAGAPDDAHPAPSSLIAAPVHRDDDDLQQSTLDVIAGDTMCRTCIDPAPRVTRTSVPMSAVSGTSLDASTPSLPVHLPIRLPRHGRETGPGSSDRRWPLPRVSVSPASVRSRHRQRHTRVPAGVKREWLMPASSQHEQGSVRWMRKRRRVKTRTTGAGEPGREGPWTSTGGPEPAGAVMHPGSCWLSGGPDVRAAGTGVPRQQGRRSSVPSARLVW